MIEYWPYGILIVGGIAGYFVWRTWLSEHKIPVDVALTAALISTPLVLIACHSIFFITSGISPSSWKAFFLTLNGWRAGYSSIGVLVGVSIGLGITTLIHKFPILYLFDFSAPGAFVASLVWRVGCFRHGCCYGGPTSLPWGVSFPDAGPSDVMTPLSHPVQLYEAFTSLALILLLPWVYRKLGFNPGNGLILLGCLLLYSVERFVLEFYRIGGTSQVIMYGMSMTQIVTLGGMVLFGIVLLIVRIVNSKRIRDESTQMTKLVG